ncbi:MAG: L-dopachrome tautomerase-related protein [Bacteroidota bacterium]
MKFQILLIILFLCPVLGLWGQSDIEVVAELDKRPGNVAVSKEGRVFSTMHPLGSATIQLVEVTNVNTVVPFPSIAYQKAGALATMDQLDTPLGIRIDKNDVLWIIDMGQNVGVTRLFGFDIATREEVFRLDFPTDIAPPGSFIQDLAVDEKNGWVYLADIADPGILAVELATKKVRRFSHESVLAEPVDMVIDGQLIYFGGAPASVAVNPITLSADRETLYYGAMSGTTWYQLSAKLFRTGKTDYEIAQSIKVVGPKPVSDGGATDAKGNHYFTNIQHHGVDILTKVGDLQPLVRDPRILWADNVALDGKGYLYITVNQLHKSPAFTGGADEGRAPYYILKVKL